MKGIILNILVIMLLPLIGFSQINTKSDSTIISNPNDSTIQTITESRPINKTIMLENRWGERLTTLLRQAEKVEVFHVESLKTDDFELPHIEQFSILNIANLDSFEEREFQQLVTDTATYYLEQGTKQCLFMPRMAIRLTTKKDTVNALFSLKCDLIRFYFDDTTLTLNCDDGRIAVLDYFSKAFPNEVFKQPETVAAKSVKPIFYKVESGDNWYKIKQKAAKNQSEKITLDNLYQWNNISKNNRDKLKIGEEVIIGFE